MTRITAVFLIVFGILIVSETSSALRPDETCELCQSVLTHTYYTYLQQSTRKIVTHRINHNCKRYAKF
uniref:Saposin B-type domain-containing protein n=1 Tax=Panagrellus redivivus TaxID=6233 RepID=A0A7E4WCF6_PANRE